MDDPSIADDYSHVLVSDFDSTMTRHDFYKLAIDKLLPADVPNHWAEYRIGAISHFEALRRYFASIRGSEEEVLSVVHQMELDPQLPDALAALRRGGWHIIVASAGCDWYINKLLNEAGVKLEVYSNPGQFEAGNGLQMRLPTDSPYFSANLGIDKTKIVRSNLDAGRTVAFAGDGFPDVEPARFVSPELRFARGDLAATLQKEELSFQRYDSWSEIAARLLRR